jgi:hypothetical protein
MAELAQAIRQVNERELDSNEMALASNFPRPPELSPVEQQRLIPWLSWCEQQRVRPIKARPTTVAAYVRYQQDQGIPRPLIAERLEAIEALHEAAALANPVATGVVRTTTAGSTIEVPRSWAKDEKQLFTQLPVEIQRVIARREADRETQMRRSQNEAADLRRLLKTAAETKPVTQKEDTTMAKWNGPQGSADMEKDPLKKDSSGLGYPKPVSILNRVEPASQQDDGFAGKLPKSE